MRFVLPWLLLSTATAGLAQPAPPPLPPGAAGGDDAMLPPRRMHLFITPMGEPVRGAGTGAELVDQWFTAADSNHDGKLSHAEFVADARRFFKTVDANGDHIIDTDEVKAYETVIAPEISGGSFGGDGARFAGGGGHGVGGGGGGGGHTDGHGGGMGGSRGGGMGGGGGGSTAPSYEAMRFGAARFSLLNIPEPVSSADADLDRSVLASEFDAAAARRFDMLDSNADGSIDRKELPDYASASGGHRRR